MEEIYRQSLFKVMSIYYLYYNNNRPSLSSSLSSPPYIPNASVKPVETDYTLCTGQNHIHYNYYISSFLHLDKVKLIVHYRQVCAQNVSWKT
jgi:hypothetical protein